VTDVIVIEPTEWWLGYHVATAMHLTWPGGIYPLEQPQHAVSRAYLKMSEAIAWSQLPIEAGQTIAEIGCAPGGASQALLDRGLLVLGIDPAEVEPIVQAHPKFVHMRKRGHEVRRREFRKVRWLAADMNVAPQYTLDTVEAIVTHPEVEIRGLLLTLKLLDWSLSAEIPNYLDRIRSWGYSDVIVRQLSHNRQEVCVCAQKS
jgi:23S rRNA (cytidine2498-2'-O)-methyltransferase